MLNKPNQLAALTFVLLVPVACQALTVPGPAELKQAAKQSGDLVLGEIEAFRSTHLADVTIQGPKFSADGSVTGTTTLGGKSSKVLMQFVPQNSGLGKWMLAVKLPTQNLGQLLQQQAAGLDALQVSTPTLVFAKQRATFNVGSLDPSVRAFYGESLPKNVSTVTLEDGVNLLTAASAQGEIKAGAETLGLSLDQLALQGVLLKNFDSKVVKQAYAMGKLTKTLGKDAQLRARLASGSLQGLPKEFAVRDLSLLVTGRPSVGLEFFLAVGQGGQKRDFQCQCSFVGGAQSKTQGVSITANSDVNQPWRDAFGIKGMNMSDVRMEIRYERKRTGLPSALIGIAGNLQFGSKYVEVSGGVQTRRGLMTVFAKGAINSLHRDDLVQIANAMATPGSPKIDARLIPEFELRDAEFTYAPAGGSEFLGIERGIGMEGELILLGSSVGRADVLADAMKPLVRIEANVNEFGIAEVELKQCELAALLTASKSSYFRFKGGARVLDMEANAEANMRVSNTTVKMQGRFANQFQADLLLRTATTSRPSWEFEAAFSDDGGIGSRAAQDLRSWARQAKADFDRAQANLNREKANARQLDQQIATARAQVMRERQQVRDSLARAQQNMQRVDQDIANARRQVQADRNKTKSRLTAAQRKVSDLQRSIDAARAKVKANRARDIAVHKRDRDRAKSRYDAAQRAFNSAQNAWRREKNPFKKVKLGVTKDAKGVARDAAKVAYYAAKKKYDVANSTINRIPVDADPGVAALIAAKRTASGALTQVQRLYASITRVPVDSDPRVAQALGRRAAAVAALRAARSAYAAIGNRGVDLDPRVAQLFVRRDAAIAALDVAKATVRAVGGTTQAVVKIAAAVTDGDIVSIRSIKVSGRVSTYDAGGRVSVAVDAVVLSRLESLRLSVSPAELKDGRFVQSAVAKLVAIGKQRG